MRTTLLELLVGLPPEQLTEGTILEVETVDGPKITVTIGPAVDAGDENVLDQYRVGEATQ